MVEFDLKKGAVFVYPRLGQTPVGRVGKVSYLLEEMPIWMAD
jgi:hypothetical protein